MVETISPVGYGDRTGRWLAAVALHAAGAAVTASMFGAVLGGLGAILGAPWGAAGVALVAAAAVLYAAREAAGLPVPVPALGRQVPDWWRSFFPWPVAAALYGGGLGVGFLTYLTHGGLVVVSVAAVAAGRPLWGAAVMGSFGLARGLSALVARPVRSVEAGAALVDRLSSADPAGWRWANAAALGLVAGAAGTELAIGRAPITRDGIGGVAGAVLAGAFAWAAAAKLVDLRRWRRAIEGYRLPSAVARAAAFGVPTAELTVPAAALLGLPAVGAGLALVLLTAFSAAVVRARSLGADRIACGCFGGATAGEPRRVLARNGVLALVASAAALAPSGGALRLAVPRPTSADLLPIALAIGGLLVAAATAWRTAAWLSRGRA